MSFRWNLSSSLRRLSLAFLPQVSWSSLSSSHTFWKGRSSIGLPASSIPTKRPCLGARDPGRGVRVDGDPTVVTQVCLASLDHRRVDQRVRL